MPSRANRPPRVRRKSFKRLKIAGATNENANRIARGDKLAGDMVAQEARGARDERGHRISGKPSAA